MPRKLGIGEARQRAGRFCAFRERSPKEVEDKLKGWGLSASEIEVLLNELLDQNFINEQRFANAFCHDKFEFNSWGKLKIRAQIFAHRLPLEVVEEALGQLNEKKYFDRLVSLANKKHLMIKGVGETMTKKKIFAYLSGKGFEADLIWRAMETIANK